MIVNETKLTRHVIFCSQRERSISLGGYSAELATVNLLVENLNVSKVGDYRILLGYNMPLYGPGVRGTLEIDLIVINRNGVFLIEVKDWTGTVYAYDDNWLQNQSKRGNIFASVENKARILSSRLAEGNVIGLIVLARGKHSFVNRSKYSDRTVLSLDYSLISAVSSTLLLSRSSGLSDDDIHRISKELYAENIEGPVIIENYLIGRRLLPGDLFEAFEAENINLATQRVRIKLYQLHSLSQTSEVALFKRSAEAIAQLGGVHPNILYTLNYFPDPGRADLFYEVTELIDGDRLDVIMAQSQNELSLEEQLDYLEPLCEALIHAHANGVYHRNICPETIFVTKKGDVKLADFDFAKIEGAYTITREGKPLIETPFTPPEILDPYPSVSASSDIFSLGMLWYFLASLPEKDPKFTLDKLSKLNNLSSAAQGLMKAMLEKEKKNRPQSASDVLEQFKLIRSQS